ncbi:MAG: GntR family transcriptional regulator [Thomasclavelia sp.]|jgi:DNA-binding GntR family transcriptional regulator|nr:GntR family transcriptional regulator [Thomasclavelia sp.]
MNTKRFKNTTHGSLGHQIFTYLRDGILNEEYTKGQKLNEVTLSKELNISRTPIREALKQLELEGLVESIPNKGVFVIGFSRRDIDDMLQIRYALEGLAVQLAIERADEEDLERIKNSAELMEFYGKKKDQEKFTSENIKFHEAIYRATKSQYFTRLLSDINYYIHVTSRHSIRQDGRLESAANEHTQIYEAIKSKDKALAKKKIEDHIMITEELVNDYYAKKEAEEKGNSN